MATITADILKTKFGFNDPNVIQNILNTPSEVARYEKEYSGSVAAAPATPSAGNTQALNADNIGGYLDTYQTDLLGWLSGGSSTPAKTSYTVDELTQALIDKGGYNPTDARNAAENKGGRADDLAREFLGVGQTSGGNGNFTQQFESIKSALQPNTPYPEALNRTQMYQDLRTQYGVAETEQQVIDMKAAQRELDAQLRINVAAERGKPVAQNVIEGRVTQQQRNVQEDYDFLSRQIAYKTDQLNTAYNAINLYMNFANLDYQDAVTRYNTEFNQNLEVINLMRGLRQDQISDQQRIIDNARANLQLYTNAITSGNLNYGDLSADQKTLISKLEVQSGLPVGFTSALQLNAKDRIIFQNTNNGVTQVGIMDAKGNVSVKSYGTPTGTSQAKVSEAISAMQTKLIELGGGDYLVSPEQWKQQRNIWQQAGYDVSKFDSSFKQTFVDWSHPEDYGFTKNDSGGLPNL